MAKARAANGRAKQSTSSTDTRDSRGRRRIRYALVGLGHIAQVAVLPAFAHAARNSELSAIVSGEITD